MTGDFEPRDEAEQQVVSRALSEERRAREDDERIESLSIRERLLIEEAWSAGASEENARIRKLLDVNDLAVTLDAQRVRAIFAGIRHAPDADPTRGDGQMRRLGYAVHYDRRIGPLLRRVDRAAEDIEREQEAQK